jgi:membrane-associated protease RseP (regulator of RpoE activity)
VLVEPTSTPYDLQFSLLGIPVRVHPFFWLMSVILGARGLEGSPQPMVEMLLWVAVVFASILVHELGHAVAIRIFGWRPRITLYAFGGLASYERGYSHSYSSYSRKGNTPTGQVIISFAGPLAGFLLAALVIAVLYAVGRKIWFPFIAWDIPLGRGSYFDDETYWSHALVWQLLFVNIYWGLLNLLPVYPLDGGQISREVFSSVNPRDGYQQSLMVSIVAGGALAVYGVYREQWWMAILFGILAYQSYQLLQHYRGGWR